MTNSPIPPTAETGDDVLVVVDLGGTQLRTAAFTRAGTMLARHSVPTPRNGGQDLIIATVVEEIRGAATAVARPLSTVGVSALGPVDPATGVVRTAPTLRDFDNVPLGPSLQDALGVPVHVFNDANAAAVAEWRLGAGRGTHNFCYVTVSTGIGCGIISNDRLVTGHTGHAGELGRVTVPTAAGPVRLEDISSGTAIAATARAALETEVETSLRGLPHPDTITAADVAAAANTGDPLAQQIYTAASESLGIQLANLTRIIDPEAIAIGGGVTLAGDAFWSPLRATVAAALLQDSIPPPRILAAGLQGDVGLHGAFMALLDHPIAQTATDRPDATMQAG